MGTLQLALGGGPVVDGCSSDAGSLSLNGVNSSGNFGCAHTKQTNRLRSHHLCIPRHVLEHLRDNMIGCDALGLGFEIEDQAVPQCGSSDCLDVVEAHVEA